MWSLVTISSPSHCSHAKPITRWDGLGFSIPLLWCLAKTTSLTCPGLDSCWKHLKHITCIRELPFNTGGWGRVGIWGGIGGFIGVFFTKEVVNLFQTLKGGGDNFYASLSNIFNESNKKAVFMKNNWIWVFIKYELKGDSEIFYVLKRGWISFLHAKGVVIFFASPTKFSWPSPHQY